MSLIFYTLSQGQVEMYLHMELARQVFPRTPVFLSGYIRKANNATSLNDVVFTFSLNESKHNKLFLWSIFDTIALSKLHVLCTRDFLCKNRQTNKKLNKFKVKAELS